MNHLNDDQIQNLIENEKETIDSLVKEHLNTCLLCQNEIDKYRLIMNSFEESDMPELSVDFNAQVMAKINSSTKVVQSNRLETVMYVLAGIVSCFAVIIYYMRNKGIVESIKAFSITELLNELTVMLSFNKFLAQNSGIVTILVFAGLTLLFFAILDKYVSKMKFGKTSLLSI